MWFSGELYTVMAVEKMINIFFQCLQKKKIKIVLQGKTEDFFIIVFFSFNSRKHCTPHQKGFKLGWLGRTLYQQCCKKVMDRSAEEKAWGGIEERDQKVNTIDTGVTSSTCMWARKSMEDKSPKLYLGTYWMAGCSAEARFAKGDEERFMVSNTLVCTRTVQGQDE